MIRLTELWKLLKFVSDTPTLAPEETKILVPLAYSGVVLPVTEIPQVRDESYEQYLLSKERKKKVRKYFLMFGVRECRNKR